MDLKKEESLYIAQLYKRFPLTIVKGEGVYVYDDEGNRYLDFAGGIAVNSLGYAHPKIIEALTSQARELIHISNLYYTKPQVELAKKLVQLTGLDKVFFCNSGTEAIEASLKFSRRWGKDKGKFKFISAVNSFHGRTMGSLSVTGQRKYQEPFEPLIDGVTFISYNDSDALNEELKKGDYAAVILEPIQGEGGVNPARREFLELARYLCDKYDTLLIFDEVQTGIGRTGAMFAFQNFGVTPDILALAKGLGGGFPIGATIINDKVAQTLHYGDHASTFGGNPLATAVANAVLEEIEKILPRIKEVGGFLEDCLKGKISPLDNVLEIRGIGLIYGIDVKTNARDICERCIKEGLLVITCGNNTVRLVPPLIINEQEIEKGVYILEKVLKEEK
ncbi:MAG TPA: aspartate aminotransferase family protein [bacterium]|nr:aspartate aminotransferase family protein [bacterium]HOL54376.1 aspartate aminotransferase family protein [bacterium]HON71744.1 aspartate aminotransferase family protein [bacterium]HPO81524.1 aspartate aminotransferase family protein [bacterium]